jgi:predicted RNase H-like HicB family nuclease
MGRLLAGLNARVFPMDITIRGVSMKSQTFTILIEQDEDGYYVATVPALKSCYTQAKTLEELYPRIKEVIELCAEEEKVTPMKFVGIHQLR